VQQKDGLVKLHTKLFWVWAAPNCSAPFVALKGLDLDLETQKLAFKLHAH
jgi:hypothetical protein